MASASPDAAGFAAEVAAQERQLAADPAAAAAATATNLPVQLAQQAISLAAQSSVDPPAAAAKTAATRGRPAAEHANSAAASAAATGPPADGMTAAAAPVPPSPTAGDDAVAVPPPLGQQASGGVEITGVQLVRGTSDSAAAADLVSKAAAAVAAFRLRRSEPFAQSSAGSSAAPGVMPATGLPQRGLSRSISLGSSREAAHAAAASDLADAAGAVRDAVVVALADAFVGKIPGGTASIARLQVRLICDSDTLCWNDKASPQPGIVKRSDMRFLASCGSSWSLQSRRGRSSDAQPTC